MSEINLLILAVAPIVHRFKRKRKIMYKQAKLYMCVSNLLQISCVIDLQSVQDLSLKKRLWGIFSKLMNVYYSYIRLMVLLVL